MASDLPRVRGVEIRRIEVILSRQANHGEQAIAAGVGKRCPHKLRVADIGDMADGLKRADPFARSMRNGRGQKHERALAIDMRRLDHRKLIFTEGLAHDVEPGGQRRIFVALRATPIAAALEDGG